MTGHYRVPRTARCGVDLCPVTRDHVSHALCRYRRYRVYRQASGGPDPGSARHHGGPRAGPARVARQVRATGPRTGTIASNRWSATSPHPTSGSATPISPTSARSITSCTARRSTTSPLREDRQRAANVDGTRAVIALARRLDATLHHVSSIAVAGHYRGVFTEDDFDVAQDLPTPYHQTKFEAELLVRSAHGPPVPDLPARRRRRRLPDRRDGQDRRALLLLRRAGQARRAAQVHADGAAGHRAHQHRSRGLRGRRARRAHARRRPRRPDVPPDRTEDDRAARHLPRDRPCRRAAAAGRVAAAGARRRRSCR